MRNPLQLLCPGGALSPSRLEMFARACVGAGVREVLLSPRQSLLAVVPAGTREGAIRQLNQMTAPPAEQNCMSSLWETRPGSSSWLSEGNLLGLVDSLDESGLRDISIVGPQSEETPRLSSRINLIAARVPHNWHVVICRADGTALHAPFLLPTFALVEALRAALCPASPSARLEEGELLEQLAVYAAPLERQEIPAGPPRPSNAVPEGFEVQKDGSVALTILAESLTCTPALLDELGYLARKHRSGRILIAPDHRLVVRQLPPESLPEWKELFERRRIRLRHDTYELNWRVAPKERAFRARIVSALRRRRAGGEGLRFALGGLDVADGADLWIEPSSRWWGPVRLWRRSQEADAWVPMGRTPTAIGVARLIDRVATLCANPRAPSERAEESGEAAGASHHGTAASQLLCPLCGTIYDPRYGDEHGSVAAGTPIEALPENYQCSVCALSRQQMIA